MTAQYVRDAFDRIPVRRQRSGRWSCWFALAVVTFGARAVAGVTITNLGALIPDGLNSHDVVVGDVLDQTGTTPHAAVWANGVITPLPEGVGTTQSEAFAVNDAGRVVGLAYVSSAVGSHAVYWDGTTGPSQIGPLMQGSDFGAGTAVDRAGDVVGFTLAPAPHVIEGFRVAAGGGLVAVGVGDLDPDKGAAYVGAITPDGTTLLGEVSGTTGSDGVYLWSGANPGGPGTRIDLTPGPNGFRVFAGSVYNPVLIQNDLASDGSVLGSKGSGASKTWYLRTPDGAETQIVGLTGHNAVNARHVVAGTITTGNPADPVHAATWDAATHTVTDLNTLLPPGSSLILIDAFAINDNGDIVGELAGVPGGAGYLLTQDTCAASSLHAAAAATDLQVDSGGDDADDQPGDGRCHTAAGECSLRAAIQEADATPAGRTITFAVPHAGATPPTIRPQAPLPAITVPTVLDAETEPCVGKVIVDGSAAGTSASGFVLSGGSSTVRGFVIDAFGEHGIVLSSDGNQVYDDVIGAAVDGTCPTPCPLGNHGSGVWITGSHNVVGDGSLVNSSPEGGVPRATPNVIAFNGNDAVTIMSGRANNVGGNRMFGNADMAIDLGDDGPTKNDRGDADTGPDDLLNAPVVFGSKLECVGCSNGANLSGGGAYSGMPNGALRIVVYGVRRCDRPERGDADRLLTAAPVTVGADGMGGVAQSINSDDTFADGIPNLDGMTGLTFAAVDAEGNTSEVSNCAYDLDGDGLNDPWEASGADLDHDGVVDLPLNEMGADPKHPDVFVEVDASQNHQLDDAALDGVRNAFRNAPVTNPLDGSTGIQLHIDNGPGSEMYPGKAWGSLSRADVLPPIEEIGHPVAKYQYSWDDFETVKRAHMDPGRWPFFHYVLSVRTIGDGGLGTLGISQGIPSADVLLGLGLICPAGIDCPGPSAMHAGAFMHELGHNLGLLHGGNNGRNFKPNFLSVMNYSFVPGIKFVRGDVWILDYSRVGSPDAPGPSGSVINLDEKTLNEKVGLGAQGDAGQYASLRRCNAQTRPVFYFIGDATEPVDWNCDGVIEEDPVSYDINQDSSFDAFVGWAEWDKLIFKGGSIGTAPLSVTPPPDQDVPLGDAPVDDVMAAAKTLQQSTTAPVVRLRGPRHARRHARFTIVAKSEMPLDTISATVDGVARTLAVPKPSRMPKPSRRAHEKRKPKALGYLYRQRFVVTGAGRHAVKAFVTDRALVTSSVATAAVVVK